MKIYTKTGDAGQTSLFSGQRVPKNHMRLHVYGTLDEMNGFIGLARVRNTNLYLEQLASRLQTLVFILCSDLATPLPPDGQADLVERIRAGHTRYLEKCIDGLTAELPPLKNFILPGGSECSVAFHLARTACRRAERWLVSIPEEEGINPEARILVNRLSDYLFTLARYANRVSGRPDEVLSREFPEAELL